MSQLALYQAWIELGRVGESVQLVGIEDPRLLDAFQFLTIALAWDLGRQPDLAAPWMTRALKELGRGRSEYQLAGAMLRQTAPPLPEDVNDLALLPSSKAILCAVLARTFPNQAKPFLDMALAMNVSRDFPFHLVSRSAAPRP
jgi:hypothetical protein